MKHQPAPTTRSKWLIGAALLVPIGALLWQGLQTGGAEPAPTSYLNSLGSKMIRIEPGSFLMGNEERITEALQGPKLLLPESDWDERPVRRVTVSKAYYVSETEITIEQYRRFRPDHQGGGKYSPYASGISWDDAVAFCQWLSGKEGKTYRLLTEAEWEYACRAGAKSHFASGDMAPGHEWANGWGVKNMHTGVPEWCFDWHGAYPDHEEVDPVGAATGVARVVRGGGIQTDGPNATVKGTAPYYRRSANRAGMIPSFRGDHDIGFRVAQGEAPETKPAPIEVPFIQQGVKQSAEYVRSGPDPDRPYFKQRPLLPIPPENTSAEAIQTAGLHPAILAHNHAPGLVVCPNGDLLAVFFSASYFPAPHLRYPNSAVGNYEYWPNTAFIATRLRYGSERWDLPEVHYDLADVNDQTSLLWNDEGTIWHFTGGVGLPGVPFRVSKSTDNGATWSAIEFPQLTGNVGGHYPQPITNAFRDAEGNLYVASDGVGGESLLWSSADNGKTWFDTGGRTGGRHTAFALLKDGSILGMGGKNTDIGGFMPKSISRDRGKSWQVSQSPFPALGANQRPALIRLASGRLFFAGDYQRVDGKQPPGVTEHGAYVALSDDEGQTWKVKTIPGALPHRSHAVPDFPGFKAGHKAGTLGYTVARQAPNAIINVISSMNHPAQHFEMNEAWILASDAATKPHLRPGGEETVRQHQENYSHGKPRLTWNARIAPDGRYLLHGQETWYYPTGRKQYQVTYHDGRKRGSETFWSPESHKVWSWEHRADDTSVWTQWWPNGRKKSESSWRDGICQGVATRWDRSGKITRQKKFSGGDIAY